MTRLLYKVHRSLCAVQMAFYRKGVVAQKKITAIKTPSVLMAVIERASVFIVIASDHDKNRVKNPAACSFHLAWHEDSRGELINRI